MPTRATRQLCPSLSICRRTACSSAAVAAVPHSEHCVGVSVLGSFSRPMPGTLVELAHDGRARKPVLAAAVQPSNAICRRTVPAQEYGLYEPLCGGPLLDRRRLASRLSSSVQQRMWVSRLLIAPAGWVHPPSQIARRSRRKSIWETAISRSRPAARSSATASRLNAAGPAPARTAARTAPADGSSSTGGACCTSTPNARRNATASESRMPARGSRHTSGVCANSSAVTARERRAHS